MAGSECFHISLHASKKAKKKFSFEWGEFAPETREAAGKLFDSEPGKTNDPLWNLTHRIESPVRDATLTLRSPGIGAVYSTTSDATGHFVFGKIPNGIYVLHIEGRTATGSQNSYSADLLFRVSNSAKPKTLVLTQRKAGGGSCGGWSLEPDYAQN
ncbi:MAG TPA: carboxypeptidase-like regulatory domain-containing protein [Candidatus Solibacter sp.]|nr:carboxypeptidase-like regulatory domain-containing protein [Candidatus Solibacter sp.]